MHMVHTGLEKSWNLTLDLKSHGILCRPGKMAFCLEKSLKISGSNWKIPCAMLNLIWTWMHWLLYDKKCHFVITFETILVKPCLQTCIAESISDQSPLHLTVSGGVLVVQNTTSYREKSNKYEANLSSINSAICMFDDDAFQWAKPFIAL